MSRINNIFNSSEISWGWDHIIERQRETELRRGVEVLKSTQQQYGSELDDDLAAVLSGELLKKKWGISFALKPEERDILRSASTNYYLQQNILIFS